MICPACGKMNEDGFRFCVKCGSNLDDPSEVTYESVDMGGYHTEEEFAQGHHSGFTMGSGVFCISDRPASDSTSEVYTSDELNDTEEEFDFSMFDEPDTAGFGTLGSAPLPPPKTIDNSLADDEDDDDGQKKNGHKPLTMSHCFAKIHIFFRIAHRKGQNVIKKA